MVEFPEPGPGIVWGLKVTVVPEGTPEADRLTALLNPPLMVLVMVTVPGLPCTTLSDDGEADSSKSTVATMVSISVVVCLTPPPLPVMVMGYVPSVAMRSTLMVIVELPEPGAGIGLGLKAIPTPVGAPEADRLIALLKPPLIVAVIVDVP